jgi:hypothetical protein
MIRIIMREQRKLRALRHDVAAKSLVSMSLFSSDTSLSGAPPMHETVGMGWLESAGACGKVLAGELWKLVVVPRPRGGETEARVGLVWFGKMPTLQLS